MWKIIDEIKEWKMQKRNKCDHVVGLCGITVKQSHIHTNTEWIGEKFAHCPLCGERIDWDKIKEEVDDK